MEPLIHPHSVCSHAQECVSAQINNSSLAWMSSMIFFRFPIIDLIRKQKELPTALSKDTEAKERHKKLSGGQCYRKTKGSCKESSSTIRSEDRVAYSCFREPKIFLVLVVEYLSL